MMQLEQLFFALGLANNLLLIAIFVLRKDPARMEHVRRVGIAYLLLALPAAYGVYLAARDRNAVRLLIFLIIFLAFLALEGVYDFWLKVPFRQNWKLLTPYLALYYGMNYGFVVMPWQRSQAKGIPMPGLFVLQILANALSHPRKGER